MAKSRLVQQSGAPSSLAISPQHKVAKHSKRRKACNQCRARRVKCIDPRSNSGEPCRQCANRGDFCTYWTYESNSAVDSSFDQQSPLTSASNVFDSLHDVGSAFSTDQPRVESVRADIETSSSLDGVGRTLISPAMPADKESFPLLSIPTDFSESSWRDIPSPFPLSRSLKYDDDNVNDDFPSRASNLSLYEPEDRRSHGVPCAIDQANHPTQLDWRSSIFSTDGQPLLLNQNWGESQASPVFSIARPQSTADATSGPALGSNFKPSFFDLDRHRDRKITDFFPVVSTVSTSEPSPLENDEFDWDYMMEHLMEWPVGESDVESKVMQMPTC